ncbi:hypothetical protein [Acuticoccus yangtzensis]|uniref:hypothetical protein n=1 Tax=Acuticoccus yangtzensis TaxID=1443441 RepID=UPI000AFEDC85|nr:hypothetical protein [Acuticoccus yangtzensis]
MDSERRLSAVEERLGALETTLSTLYAKNVALVPDLVPDHPVAEQASATLWLDMGFDHPAFYTYEARGDGLGYHWIGRENSATFTLPVTRRQPRRVDVYVVISINDKTLNGLTISCDGRTPASYDQTKCPDGTIRKSATFDAVPGSAGAALTDVKLSIGAKVDLTPQGDPRTLAVGIHKIVVTAL